MREAGHVGQGTICQQHEGVQGHGEPVELKVDLLGLIRVYI